MDCVISTPLRLISTISSGKIDFAKVEVLVMDEGDKLFEDGFIEQVVSEQYLIVDWYDSGCLQ